MRQQLLGAVLALAFALVLAVVIALALAGPSSAAPTYINGDWDIDNGDTITRTSEEIILTGNLTVKTGGELTLRSVTLKLNSSSTQRYHIEVEDGGVLNIYDGDGSPSTTGDASLITAADARYNYAWYVVDGGELYINDSRVEECGVSNPADDRGLLIESSSVVVDSVAFKSCYYGLIANYATPTVRDCTFTDCASTGAYLYSSSTNVLRCTFTSCPYGVAGYYAYPKVTDSTFTSSSTYGIYLYDAAAEIDGCTMSSMSYTGIITQYNSVTITDTTVNGAVTYGIISYYSTLTMARDAVNNSGTGIYSYRNAAGSTITDCKATNCSSNGVYVYLAPTRLTNVQAYDSTTNGIYLNRASGAMSNLRVEDAAVGLYMRDSTSTVTGLTVKGCTSSGLQSSGGSPYVYAFAISGSATGVTGTSTTTLKAYNGSVSTSTTRDVDVSGTSTVELTNVSYAAGLARVQDAGSLLRRYWWVDLCGVWQDGSAVATGTYTVATSGGSTVLSGTLGADGYARGLRVQQSETTSVGTSSLTPHTFSVSKGGLSGNRVSTIDQNRPVTVTLTDSIPPSGYIMSTEPQYTKGTWNQVSWTAGSDVGVGGIEYWCEMSDVSSFAYYIASSGWTTSLSQTFSGLSDGVLYYYRAHARDSVGNVGSWSNVVSSRQDSAPPSVPVVVEESDFTLGTSNTVTWGASTDAGIGSVQYQAQYTNDPTFATVLGTSAWQAGTSITYNGLADGTRYYYRVKARDGFGQESQWAAPVRSTQDASAPPSPTMVTEDTYTKGLSNSVSWTTVVDAGIGGVEYYAEWDDEWWFPSPGDDSGWLASTSFTFTGLPENTWVYYRVRARDALLQESAPSWVVWSWQDNSAPSVPVITAEPQYTAGNANTVAWAASSDGSGAWGIEYLAEADMDAAFATPDFRSDWTAGTSWTFSSLVGGATYYYRVHARDAVGWESSWSSTASSTQDASPPPVPTMDEEPAYTARTSNAVSWSVVTDAGVGGVEYRVQASTSPSFSPVFAQSPWQTGTSYTFTGLSDATTYYYHVSSRDSYSQQSQWSSAVHSMQDASAPSAPTMVQTGGFYYKGLYYVASWNAVADAGSGGVQYWCEYDDASTFASPNGNSGWTSSTSHNFTGLSENVWYYYRAKARDAVGQESGWSGIIFARQDASPPGVPTMVAEPQYTAGTSNSVSWSTSSDGSGIGQVTYKAQCAASGAFSPVLAESLWQTSTSFTFSGLSSGTTYYFRVRARDGLGQESGFSSQVSTTMDSTAPTVPFLAAEPAFTQGASNAVGWSTSSDTGSGGVQYEAQASTSPAFTTVTSTGWMSGTTYTFTGLSETTYYYRVHARDAVGQASAWSSVESSTQDATGPTAPAIVAEPAYTAGTSNTVYWGASTDAGAGGIMYYIWYDDDAFFGSPNAASGLITATQYTFNNVPEGVTYYYEVISVDSLYNWGSWSATTSSRQDNTAPTVPTMTAEPTYTVGTTNAVAWSASTDAGAGGIAYQSELASSNTFAVVLDQSQWTTARGWTFTGLVDGTTYYYRVRARDALDHVSSYSNVVVSTQDASAPPAPFLAAEPAYTVGTSNALTWSAVTDGGSGGVQYNAQRSTSPAFTSVVSSGWISATTHTFTGLASGTTYYYRVAARDSLGQQSAWSNVVSSTQDNTAPTVPGSVALPLYTEGTSLTFSWTASTDAGAGGVQYYAEYDNDAQFRTPNGNSGWFAGTSYTFTGLAEGTLFFYHVRARDGLGTTSGWSTIRFSIQDASPPTVPTMSAEPAFTTGTTNAVSWSAATDAGVGGVSYQVLCDDDSSMATPALYSGWVSATSYTFSGLSDGVRYYYAVQSRDSFDHRSALSATVSSTQDASAPTTPSLEVEPEYTQGTANALAWSAAVDSGVGGVQYRLEWATAPSFAALAGALDWFTGTSASVSGLTDGTKYYWRVRARDSLIHVTPWSNVVWSTQDASAPPSPTMAAEPTYTPGTTNMLFWSEVVDAGIGGEQYICEVSTDAAFTSPLASGWTTWTWWTWANLGDGSRYWYRVRSRDSFDQRSAWSNAVSSTQDDRAPTVPSLTAEPGYTAGTTNELSWSAATDSGVGGVEYEVQCSMDSTFATISLASPWSPSTSYTFSGLSDGVTYHFRVRSRDAFDHRSAWSSVVRSTQDASAPTQPSLAAEPPFTQGTSNTVTWSASTDAGVGGVQYLVQCAQDGAFAAIVGQSSWSDATQFTFTGLRDGTTYYYRARSRDAFGYMSPWSVVERSTQDASPPSTPELAPEPEFTEGTSNTVLWSLSIDAGVGGVLYYCEWDFSGAFQSPRGSSGWVPALEWTFTGLPERSIFYHVRAMDALGQLTPWSNVVRSTQDAAPPSTPALNDLAAFTKGRAVAVSWSPAVDLGVARVEYWAEWDDDAAFGSPGGSSGWVPSATFTFDMLPEHVVLSFRVRARDAFDHRTPWSAPRTTTCDATAPTVPYLASEPLFTEGTTNRLEWSTSVDLGVGGVEYEVQATTDPTWDRVDHDSLWVKATSHTFTGLLDAKAHYYRARARDTFQWTSAWSPVVSSVQDAAPPAVPALRPEPPFTEGRENTLEWTEVVDAGVGGVEYALQWSAVSSFATVGGDSGWVRELRHTFAGLPEGTSVHYRLRARDAFGQESAWSAAVSSAQDASPPQVPVVRPEPAYTAGSSNTVEWLASLDAGVGGVQYLAQASTSPTFADIAAESEWSSQTMYTFRNLGDGILYGYRVRARDAFGHESAWSAAVSSTQDASAPVIALDPLPPVISTRTLRLTGTISDAGSGTAMVEFSDDGGATWTNMSYGPTGWSFTWARYSSGRHTLLLRATDALGNRLAPPLALELDVDLDAPEAAITSPGTNDTLTGLVPVRGTARDAHMALYGLYWTRNGVNLTAIVEQQPMPVTGSTLAIWDTRFLDDGVYDLLLEVNDTTGRTTWANVTVRLLNSDMELSPGDLVLSNPYPYEGNNLTILATLRNAGTSRARDVRITVTDNGEPLYEGTHTVGPGDVVTVQVPYVVPDHRVLHVIRVQATYRDNPGDRGASAAVSLTGKEVVEEPFFSTSELATLAIAIIVAIVCAVLGAWMLDRRRGGVAYAPAPAAAAAPAGMSYGGMQRLGMESIQWDDDRF